MPGFDALIKFRCYQYLVDRLERLAHKHRRAPSDFYRLIMEDYVAAEEKRLGLPPITTGEVEQLLAAERHEKPASMAKPLRKPVRYDQKYKPRT